MRPLTIVGSLLICNARAAQWTPAQRQGPARSGCRTRGRLGERDFGNVRSHRDGGLT